MRISSLTLNEYLLLKDSDITEMSVTFTEPVQLIIGSNGSGKSSLLRQLSLYPSVRSLFGKSGFKSLVVEKDSVYYKLDSEYEKPSSPHAFYEGESEENLNVGRTTDTQKELIVEHLGITSLVDDLIMNRLTFPKWGAAKRREFLMDVNPDQIGFVLPLIKQTTSKIKACRNNLSRLQQRKILLEQDFLDDEALITLEQEKQSVNRDLESFQQYLMDITVGLKLLKPDTLQFSLSDLPAIKNTIRRCHYKLSGLSHISRDDHKRQLDRESTLSSLAVCDQQLKEIDEDIVTQSSKLVELETRYRDIAIEGDLKTIDDTIDRLESERNKLLIVRPQFEVSYDDLQIKYKELDVINDRLQIFSTLSIPLIPTKKRQKRER